MLDLNTTFVEELPVKLTEREELERSRQASGLGAQIVAAKEELKAQQAEGKRAIERMEAQFTHLWQVINARQERRPVECIQRVNEHTERLEKVRTDTGEVFSSRPLTPEELRQVRQPALRFPTSLRTSQDVEDAAAETAEHYRGKRKGKRKVRKPAKAEAEVIAEAEALLVAADRFKGRASPTAAEVEMADQLGAEHAETREQLRNGWPESEHDEDGVVPPSEPPGPVMTASGLPEGNLPPVIEIPDDDAEPPPPDDDAPPSSIPGWESDGDPGDDELFDDDGGDDE